MSRSPVVFVGVATQDTIALVARFPDPDERLLADDLVHAGGGPAATAAVAAARLGAPTAFIGAVGDDDDGDAIIAGLDAEGVDTDGVVRVRGARSASSVVIVDTSRASRAIVHRPGPALVLADSARELVAAADWIHVDHAGWGAVHHWWQATAPRPRLSIDAGNPIEEFSPDGVDLFVPTIAALRRRYGDGDPAALLGRAIDEGARAVVATDGAVGAYALAEHQPFLHVPGLSGSVRSTLGAGDVYHGALLAGVVRGCSIAEAMAEAGRAAFLSCRGLDGRSAIPKLDQLATDRRLPCPE